MKRAWAYYRYSTDKQERSIPAQKDEIQKILEEHEIVLIEEFEDEAISGVDAVEKRPAFSKMLRMAKSGFHRQQEVTCILCYDISRWGRFRDPLDSIAYMQDFKRIGLPVHFTHDNYVRLFADTREAANGILMVLGSMQATGYSKERSKLTTRGQKDAANAGFWAGGITPYGMVRVLLDAEGNPSQVLEDGEQKAVKNQRVILKPGSAEKVQVVKKIFNLRVQNWGYGSIAKCLNNGGIPAAKGGNWSGSAVLGILRNDVYAGNFIFGRRDVSKFNDRGGKLI